MKKDILNILCITFSILLIPFIAMQFTSEVVWTLSDFIIMGLLLFVTGIILIYTARKGGKYRIAWYLLIILVFLYIWAELAVGIFTNLGS